MSGRKRKSEDLDTAVATVSSSRLCAMNHDAHARFSSQANLARPTQSHTLPDLTLWIK